MARGGRGAGAVLADCGRGAGLDFPVNKPMRSSIGLAISSGSAMVSERQAPDGRAATGTPLMGAPS